MLNTVLSLTLGSIYWQDGILILRRPQDDVMTWQTFRHYGDVIMGAIASQITSLTIVYPIVYSDADKNIQKTSKLRVTGLCTGNSPGTDEFPAQMGSNAENASIWWRHHDYWCFARGTHRPPPVVSPRKGSVIGGFFILIVVIVTKHLNNGWSCRWFETPWPSCDINVMFLILTQWFLVVYALQLV